MKRFFLTTFEKFLKKKKRFYLFTFRDRGREGENEGNTDVREKHRSVASHMLPDPKSNWQHFCFAGWCPTNWATLVRALLRNSAGSQKEGSLPFPIWDGNIHVFYTTIKQTGVIGLHVILRTTKYPPFVHGKSLKIHCIF